jgi:hypothetical protein
MQLHNMAITSNKALQFQNLVGKWGWKRDAGQRDYINMTTFVKKSRII